MTDPMVPFPDEEWVTRFFKHLLEDELVGQEFSFEGPIECETSHVLVVSRDSREADVTWRYDPEHEDHHLSVVTAEGKVLMQESGTIDDLLPLEVEGVLTEWFGPLAWWHRLGEAV